MSLPETVDFDKDGRIEKHSHVRRLFLALVIILVAVLSFGIGRLSGGGNREPVKIEYDKTLEQSASVINSSGPVQNTDADGVYASSKGKRYYYPWCKSTVSEANKVTFTTPAMAESAGYTLASNCLPHQ